MTEADVSHLIEEFHVPQHVRRHCAAVAQFAVELGGKLIKKGEKIDLELLRQSALLHDLVRVVDFRVFEPKHFPDPVTADEVKFWEALRKKYHGVHHADVGADILMERGFPRHAELVRKHRFTQIKNGFDSWEEKLLYYADKRAKHDTIVPLKERLEDGRRRNLPDEKRTIESEELEKKVYELEKEILEKAL